MRPKRTFSVPMAAGIFVCFIWAWAVQPGFGQPGEEGFGGRGGGRGGRGGGPGREGERLGGPGEMRRPWELTDDMIERIMKSIEKTNPAKAKELSQLRDKDPSKFREQLGIYGRDEMANIFRELMDSRRRAWQTEYIAWLEKNYPQEAESLSKQKKQGPEEYMKRLDSSIRKYGEIFGASRDNPELAVVLKEDLELREKRDELVKKIRAEKNADEKKNLMSQLEDVVGSRFDLIVRRKEIAYEQLLKKLEELKQQISQSRDELSTIKEPKSKTENVKKHIEDIMKGVPRFRWD